jgi:hypothetical protein
LSLESERSERARSYHAPIALVLYTLTAAALLWVTHRLIRPLSRGAAVYLFFLPFVFTGYALVAGRVYAPIDRAYDSVPLYDLRDASVAGGVNPATTDIYSQMIPWRHVVRETLARGEWPLWNPSILSGDILGAAAQPAAYSPFTWIACLLPAAVSFTFGAAIAFFVAGLGAFVLARELGCGEAAAAIAAAGFAFSTPVALYSLWPLGFCWALFPSVLFATHRLVTTPSVRSWAILTAVLSLLLVSGHPATVPHIVLLASALGILLAVRQRHDIPRVLGAAIVAGVVSLLVCAIFLLPFVEAIPQTAEHQWRSVLRGVERDTPAGEVGMKAAADFLPLLHLRRSLSPDLGGRQGESAAVGSIVLALAVYAIWRARSGVTWLLAAIALIGILAKAGWPPLANVLRRVPLLDITINERLAFGAACALAVLAALGTEEMVRRGDRRGAVITLLSVLVILALGTLYVTHSFALDGPPPWAEYKVVAELAGLAAAVLVAAILTPAHRAFAFALLALAAGQRFGSDGRIHASFPARAAYPPIPLLEPLEDVREPFRIVGKEWALIPNTSALYGLEDVRGYEAMTFAPYAETYPLWCVPQAVFFNRVDDLSKPFLSMMNVRFAITARDAVIPPGWKVVSEQKSALLLESPHVLERAFVPNTVRLGLSDAAAVKEMAAVRDFRELGWITIDGAPYERTNGPGRVTRLARVERGYELTVDMDGDGWVIVSDSAWKGWRAYLDGRRQDLQRGNVAFLATHVPAGRHQVRLTYWPESFVRGRAVSVATLLALLVFAVVRRRTVRP